MNTADLVADYLAKGGKVTVVHPNKGYRPTGNRARDPWWVRSDWTLVRVPVDRMADAEAWLREREVEFYKNVTTNRGLWHFRIADRSIAVLFKLTWCGA